MKLRPCRMRLCYIHNGRNANAINVFDQAAGSLRDDESRSSTIDKSTLTRTAKITPIGTLMKSRRGNEDSSSPPPNDNGTDVPVLRDSAFVTEEFLPYLLNQTTNVWNRNFNNAIRRSPVKARQWRVLAMLLRTPGMSLTELVENTAVDQPTLSRMIDQLNIRGLVKREVAENDARYLRLSVTEEGEALVEELWPIAWRQYHKGIAKLTPEEQAVLVKLLNRVLDSLQP
ncbi:MarR family winged helix-turn-helix transcriptional regulator [Nocardia sp. R16R-3T]